MRILDGSIWYGGIALELLLLVRAFRSKLWFVYPVFYTYIAFVLVQSLLRLFIFHFIPELYSYIYWSTEFIGVALGCAVVFEIYRVGLAGYPGTARLARRVLALVFVAALTKAIAETSNNPHWLAATTTIAVERALRVVQALGIAALLGLFLVYAIPFGRNLRGVLVGYGLFISASVLWFTFANTGGERFRYFWSYLNPGTYDLALGLWVACLWSRDAQTETRARIQEEYQRTAERTRGRLAEAGGYLGKVIDP
jgi:hypothetical protein